MGFCVLSRKPGEEIILRMPKGLPPGATITLRQCEIRGAKSRLGIDAPRDSVEIIRAELLESPDPNQEAA